MPKRKKSLVGWTYSGWQAEFRRSIFEYPHLQIPETFTSKKDFSDYEKTDDPSLMKKVRITMQEL